MIPSLFGCEILEVLHQGERSVVYRARQAGQVGTCILKTARSDLADPVHARRLRREYELLSQLSGCESVPRCMGKLFEGERVGLVLSDSGARSLAQLGLAGGLSLDEFFALASKLVAALEQIHELGVLHRDLHPGNVLVNSATGVLQLIDFGSAALIKGGLPSVPAQGSLEGKLGYIAPEQTGRVNRSVDYRSDYYSMGVMLFELLTGVLPFASRDPLELVHAHLARQPPAADALNPTVPPILSKIIGKLLAKDADERYQSMAALRADLLRVQRGPASERYGMEFELAASDRYHDFRFPQRLYGRERELEALCNNFDRVCAGQARVVLVAGPSGVGKSRFVKEIASHVNARRGHFTSAKYEQYKHNVPFEALGEALDEVAKQILTESAANIAVWRQQLLSAVSGAGRVLIELCPSFEPVLGTQPEVGALPPREAAQRLRQVMIATARVLATAEHPLCVFMDDMQWAGAASMQVFKEAMLTLRDAHLLLISAVRDAEAGPTHPLWLTLEEIEAAGVPITRIPIQELSYERCQELIADALSLSGEPRAELARLVHARTSGNPFFVRAFLQSLHNDGLLDGLSEAGMGALDAIRRRGVTENVVELLIDRVARLPVATQQVLRFAACLGSQFELGTLTRVLGRPAGVELWPALVQELVLPLEDIASEAEFFAREANVRCRFAHDRIQQAIISTLSEERRSQLHLEVGRSLRLLAHQSPNLLFEASRHLNHALSALSDAGERRELAALDLAAARESMRRSAGAEASNFALAGIAALGPTGFSRDYELTLDLHLTAAEAAFEWADHESLNELVTQIISHARSPLDSARARRLSGRAQQARGQSRDAIRTYLEALRLLGYELPESPNATQIQEELRDTARALRGREVEALLDLPECRSAEGELARELLSKLIFFAYAAVHELLPVAVCRLVRASVTEGNTAESANGYTFYGLLLSRDHDLDRAHRFGRVALELAHRYDNPAVLSQTYLYANYLLMHWKLPLSALATEFRKAHQYGLVAGSPLNAACSATTLCICRFWSGAELSSLAGDMLQYREQIQQFSLRLVLNWHEVLLQTVVNLNIEGASPSELLGPYYTERERLPQHSAASDKSSLFNYYVAKALLCYLFDEPVPALACADAILPLVPLFATALWAVPVAYLDALVRLARADEVEGPEREALLASVEQSLRRLRGWASHNPADIACKVVTLEAELSRVRGDQEQARLLFRRAVELARNGGSALDEGITYELQGKHALHTRDQDSARVALQSSREAFRRWGAHAKVLHMEHRYAEALRSSSASISFASFLNQTENVDVVDLLGVMHASRAISGEIRLDRLLQRLMELLIESAGADVAYLLLERGGNWVIEAGRVADRGVVTTLESLELSALAARGLPEVAASIVNYVASTAETVLLGDAALSPRFGADPRFRSELTAGEGRAASLLCFPLRRMQATRAIVYLENRLSREAFTARRIKALELLSSQAVISLENARLYDELEQKVEKRTRELLDKNAELGRALQQVTEMQRQLVTQEKLAALGALTAGIAHEIKNPLNFITNFADVSARLSEEVEQVLEPELDRIAAPVQSEVNAVLGELRVAVHKIAEHGARATAIINGMAAHARGGSGPRESTSLNALLAQSVELAAHAVGSPGLSELEIQSDYDPQLEPLDVVPQDISRVFVNLINNARYAMEQKRARAGASYAPLLSVATRDLPDAVEIRIADNGIGIPQAVLDKIFIPFFTTKAAGQGTGLGLSISHEIIVRGHGGELRVESVEGERTEFIIRLPKPGPKSDRRG